MTTGLLEAAGKRVRTEERLWAWKTSQPAAPYWWMDDVSYLPARDFCRQVIEPGTSKEWPRGAVNIRCYDGFWLVASLPYHFFSLSTRTIVAILWPELRGIEIVSDVPLPHIPTERD